jgi:ATP-binding cassette subfamily B protein
MQRIRARSLLTMLAIVLVFGTIVFVLWLGAHAVLEGTMTGGDLGQFILYASIVAGSIGALSEVMGEAQRAAGATERLLELLAARSDIRNPAHPRAACARRQWRRPRAARRDLRLSVAPGHGGAVARVAGDPPGETVAVVGPSGRRQDHPVPAAAALLRPAVGAITPRRRRHPRPRPAHPARCDRHRAPGYRDLLGRRDGKHPLRPPGRDATRK